MRTQQTRINSEETQGTDHLRRVLENQRQTIHRLQTERDALAQQQRVTEELRQSIQHLEQQLQRKDQTIKQLKNEVERLKQRLAQYEPEVLQEKQPPAEAAQYSVYAEEKRRKKRKKKKKSPGRRRTAVKFSAAQVLKDVVPPGFTADQCRVVRQRAVWRLIDGRAVLVGYTIYPRFDSWATVFWEPRVADA